MQENRIMNFTRYLLLATLLPASFTQPNPTLLTYLNEVIELASHHRLGPLPNSEIPAEREFYDLLQQLMLGAHNQRFDEALHARLLLESLITIDLMSLCNREQASTLQLQILEKTSQLWNILTPSSGIMTDPLTQSALCTIMHQKAISLLAEHVTQPEWIQHILQKDPLLLLNIEESMPCRKKGIDDLFENCTRL